MREHGGKHEYRAEQQYRITLSRTSLTLPATNGSGSVRGRARRNVEDRWNKSIAWGTYRWPRSSEDDLAGQRGGDGDGERRRKI